MMTWYLMIKSLFIHLFKWEGEGIWQLTKNNNRHRHEEKSLCPLTFTATAKSSPIMKLFVMRLTGDVEVENHSVESQHVACCGGDVVNANFAVDVFNPVVNGADVDIGYSGPVTKVHCYACCGAETLQTQKKMSQPPVKCAMLLYKSCQHLFEKDQEGDVLPQGCYQCSLTGEELETLGNLTGTLLSPGAVLQYSSLSAVVRQSPTIPTIHQQGQTVQCMSVK